MAVTGSLIHMTSLKGLTRNHRPETTNFCLGGESGFGRHQQSSTVMSSVVPRSSEVKTTACFHCPDIRWNSCPLFKLHNGYVDEKTSPQPPPPDTAGEISIWGDLSVEAEVPRPGPSLRPSVPTLNYIQFLRPTQKQGASLSRRTGTGSPFKAPVIFLCALCNWLRWHR